MKNQNKSKDMITVTLMIAAILEGGQDHDWEGGW